MLVSGFVLSTCLVRTVLVAAPYIDVRAPKKPIPPFGVVLYDV